MWLSQKPSVCPQRLCRRQAAHLLHIHNRYSCPVLESLHMHGFLVELFWLFNHSPKYVLSHSVVSDSLWPYEQEPTRLLCPWDSPGKNTGVGCHFHLQPQSTVRFQLHRQSGKKEGRKHSSCGFWQRTPVNKASLWPTCGISGKPMAWPLGSWEARAQQGCNGHFPLKGVCPESVSNAPGLLTVTSQNIHLIRVTFTRIRHTFSRGWWKVPFRYKTIYNS